jgi:hypothetical protein
MDAFSATDFVHDIYYGTALPPHRVHDRQFVQTGAMPQ